MTTQNDQRTLVDGPSKFDLMLALFDRDKGPRKVTFTDNNGMKYEASIAMVEIEDGSGESWVLEGQTQVQSVVGVDRAVRPPMRFRFKSYFRTDKRIGHIVFTSA